MIRTLATQLDAALREHDPQVQLPIEACDAIVVLLLGRLKGIDRTIAAHGADVATRIGAALVSGDARIVFEEMIDQIVLNHCGAASEGPGV